MNRIKAFLSAIIEDCQTEIDTKNPGFEDIKENANAVLARIEALELATKPFTDFASLHSFDKLPDDTPLTQGSRLAARQITAGDFKRLLKATRL